MHKAVGRNPIFEIIRLDCAAHVESVVGRARSRLEADRLVSELAAGGAPSTLFFWVARGRAA